MSKQAKDKKNKKPSKAAPIAAAAAPPPPIGSAQQEAPPPIEGPARAMVIMAHPDDAEFVCCGHRREVVRGRLGCLLRPRHRRRQGHARRHDAPGEARRHPRGGAARRLPRPRREGVHPPRLPRRVHERERRTSRPDRAPAAPLPAGRRHHLGRLPRDVQPPRPPQRRPGNDGRHLPASSATGSSTSATKKTAWPRTR